MCGPVVGSIIEETLRYLDIDTDYTVVENDIKEKVVPDLTSKTVAEAKSILEEKGMKLVSDTNLSDTDVIKDQIPKSGASLMDGSTIRVYTNDEAKSTVTVPDIRNKDMQVAINQIRASDLNIRVIGKGSVLTQDPTPGAVIEKGSIVTVKCADTEDLP